MNDSTRPALIFAIFILPSSGNRVASVEVGRKKEKIGRVGG